MIVRSLVKHLKTLKCRFRVHLKTVSKRLIETDPSNELSYSDKPYRNILGFHQRMRWPQNAPKKFKKSATDIRAKLLCQNENEFRFSCTVCGDCCRWPGEIYFTPQDIENVYDYLKLDKKGKAKLQKKIIQKQYNGYFVHKSNGPCRLLNRNGLCSVYPVRPLQCRSFPFWPSVFYSKQNLQDTARECPGTLAKESQSFSAREAAQKINKTGIEFLASQKDPAKYFMI